MARFKFLLLLLPCAVLIAGFIPFSADALNGRIVKAITAQTGGDTLRFDRLSVRLWRGVTLKELRFATRADKDPRIRLSVPRVQLSWRLLPLLRGKVVLYRITVLDPRAELFLRSQPAASSRKTGLNLPPIPVVMGRVPLDLPVDLEVSDFRVRNGGADISDRTGLLSRIRGLQVGLSATLDEALSAKGEVRIDSLWAPPPYLFTGFKTDLALSPGRLRVKECAFLFYGGKGRASVDIDTASKLPIKATFSMRNLNLEPLLKATGFNRGRVAGRAGLDIEVHGRDPNPMAWQGKGLFKLKDVDLSSLPFQKTLATVLFLRELEHLQFDQVKSSLNLSMGKIATPDLEGTGNLINFRGSGWVGLNLKANEKVNLSLSRELCSRLPPLISRDIMQPGLGGRCEVGAELTGPLSDLRIALDRKTQARATRAIIKEAGGLLRELMRKR